ncbi:hypothetical protein [Luethyella okanaganae]|uniref:Serine/threonine protein kinase n=1 Tax=Luethyella okanaganae TaxID=69372 RepID=A0ABW1VFG6_9MICO
MTATEPPVKPPLARRPVFWLTTVVAILLVGTAVIAGFMAGGSRLSGAESTDAAGLASRPTPVVTTAPTPVPTPEPEIPGFVRPATCVDIYTNDWAAQLGPLLVLNPDWTNDPSRSPKPYATNDVGLGTVLEATTGLVCHWVKASGGGDVGLTTDIAYVTAEQQASTIELMQRLGFDCYGELGGTRCVTESNEEAGSFGESHFLRDGVWVATRWVNTAPDGYTHDIVSTLFPE